MSTYAKAHGKKLGSHNLPRRESCEAGPSSSVVLEDLLQGKTQSILCPGQVLFSGTDNFGTPNPVFKGTSRTCRIPLLSKVRYQTVNLNRTRIQTLTLEY